MASKRKVVAANSHFSNLDYILSLTKYIPSLVLHQLVEREQSADKMVQLPELQPMETVVLFADISGFTNLSEACAKKGVRGNEELAFCINRYMEGMVTNLNQYGGDIIKFVGDAMIVMWPPINLNLADWQSTRNDTIRRAIQCSQDIQKHMNNLQILPGATLSVKIGIGYGKTALLYVGGVFSRSESFTIGEALVWALKSEGNATGGGQIVVAEAAFQYVREYFKAKEIISEENPNHKFYLIDYKHQGLRVKIQADSMKLRSQFTSEILTRIQGKMAGTVASSIIPYLQIDQERYGSENRSLTVVFVNLGVELSSANTKEGMAKIQSIVTAVQKQVYRLQGSLNKLVMDDKGSTLICLWGLLPFAHDDDAARAILAGYNMIEALSKIDGTYCNIGISSGECFSGVVGTSGSRKEFSVLGDIVNLAARIVGVIKGQKLKNEIRCDLNTRMLAANFFEFSHAGHSELKGKSISIPLYKATNPREKFDQARNKVLSPEHFLLTHMNPLNLERNTDMNQKIRTLGFDEMMGSMVKEIENYFSEDSQQNWPYLAVIKGEIGSGKTAFARELIEKLHKADEFVPYIRRNKDKLPVFTSSVNAETQLHFLNVWKPIFQMMLNFFCKQKNMKKEIFLADALIVTQNQNKVDLICDITGVRKEVLMQKRGSQFAEFEQIQPMMGDNPFISRPEYTKQEKEELIELLTQLMKCLIGEESDVSGWNSVLDPRSRSKQDLENEEFEDKPPFIIVLDNGHDMDPTSWHLMESIVEECYRVVIILLVQSDDMDRMKIHPGSVAAFESVWDSIAATIEIVEKDLPRLSQKHIGDIIIQNASKYKNSYTIEMKDMTKIVDKQTTIKTEEMGDQWREILTKKWQLSYSISQVDERILRVVTTKCRGNPLLSMQYFINMLHYGFIEIQANGYVEPKDKFLQCIQLNEWTCIPVPRLSLKLTSQLLDQFYYSIQSKGKNQRPGELQGCTSAIVLLKAASVLGEEFEIKALKQISPFPKSNSSSKRVEDAIRLLEQRDLIEIVDETDQKNCLCRFNKCFLQESVYQILLYKSCKKDLHSATEKYIQTMPSLTSKKDNTLMTERLLRHMLLAQDTEEENDLLIERRSALVVLRIQTCLNMNPRSIVLKDRLFKQGKAINKNVEKRLVTLTQYELKWYHDDEVEFANNKYMGLVKLPFIYDVVKSKQAGNEKPAFMISVTMFYNKKMEEQSKRDIYFSCDTEQERDKWMTGIDYLKTRAIYDAYAKKSPLLGFINHDAEEEIKQDQEGHDRDLSDLLYDFGDRLKGNTPAVVSGRIMSAAATVKETLMLTNRKASVLRQNVEKSTITAYDLLPKLEILYNIGITSFLHHLGQKNFKTKAIIAKSAQGKQGAEIQRMQFPELATWDTTSEIEKILLKDAERAGAGTPDTTSSRGRGSISMQAMTRQNNLYLQNSVTSHKDYDAQKGSTRRTDPRKSSTDDFLDGGTQRRPSTLSADHMMTLVQQNLPSNDLIREEKEEDSSEGSDNGLSKLSSKDITKKKARFSQEVQAQDLTQLKHNKNFGQNEKSSKKMLSLFIKNSEESSKGMSTPLLTGTVDNLPQQISSQDRSFSDPIDGDQKTVFKEGNDSTDLRHLTNTIVRENRYTFASGNAGEDEAEGVDTSPYNEKQPRKANEKSQESNTSVNVTRSTRKGLQVKENSRLHHKNRSLGQQAAKIGQRPSFSKSSSTDQQHKSNENAANEHIGKETDKKELSIIQHKYDSRNYGEMSNSMIIEPLLLNGAPAGLHTAHKSSRVDDSQQSRSADLTVTKSEKQQSSQESSKTLIDNIGSIIKQQLGQGLNDLFLEQQEKIQRMAEQQQQMHEQMTRQQQHILNSSFQQAAIIQQQQQLSLSQQQISLSQNPYGITAHQTPTQFQQIPSHIIRPFHPLSSASTVHSNYVNPMQLHTSFNQEFMTPKRIMTQNSFLQNSMHMQHQPIMVQHSQVYPTTNTVISDFNQGGMTSKRSHKHLLDSDHKQILPKSERHHEDDEPADPMMEVVDFKNSLSTQRRLQMQNQVKLNQIPPPSYELDLQEYLNRKQNSAHAHQQSRQPEQHYFYGAKSFQVPTQSQTMASQPREPVNLIAQLSDDVHTENETTLKNRSILYSQQNFSPQQDHLTKFYPTKADMLLKNNQYEAVDEAVSAKTIKPTYHDGVQSYQFSSHSHQLTEMNQPNWQQHGHNSAQTQLASYQQKIYHRPQYIEFADKPLVFPPPEQWTETQYALYEEPLVTSQVDVGRQESIIATAVRDTTELKMRQTVIKRGTKVNVLEIINEAQICKVELDGQVGLFQLQDFIKTSENFLSQTRTLNKKNSTAMATTDKRRELNSNKLTRDPNAKMSENLLKQLESDDDHMPVNINVSSKNVQLYHQTDSYAQGPSGSHHQNRGVIQDSTIEQMSPIEGIQDQSHAEVSRHTNFFREEPEKAIYKQLKSLTSRQLAQASKQFLEEDKADHKQKNLKMVERQRRKAQAARRQAAEKQRTQTK